MFASVPLCLLPPPTKNRIYPPPLPGSGYILGYTPPRPRTAHTPHPPRIPHPARHALRAPRAPRVPSASCPTNARPSFSFLPPNKKQDIPASPSRKRIYPRLYAHFAPAVPLPPSPQPPKPRAPLRAPSYLHPLPAHLVRPSRPVRVPLRPRRTSASFHRSPRTPHPRAPPASPHIRTLPSLAPRTPSARPSGLVAHPHPSIPLPRTPSARPSGLAAHPHPSIPRPSHPVRAPLRPRRTSAPFHPAPSPHPRTPAYLLGYIPPHIRRSPSSSSLYVYRRS